MSELFAVDAWPHYFYPCQHLKLTMIFFCLFVLQSELDNSSVPKFSPSIFEEMIVVEKSKGLVSFWPHVSNI